MPEIPPEPTIPPQVLPKPVDSTPTVLVNIEAMKLLSNSAVDELDKAAQTTTTTDTQHIEWSYTHTGQYAKEKDHFPDNPFAGSNLPLSELMKRPLPPWPDNWRRLPLYARDKSGKPTNILIVDNLKERIFGSRIDYLTKHIRDLSERGLLSIENEENISLDQITDNAGVGVERLLSRDALKVDHAKSLCTFLSWSYYQETEHPISDDAFTPSNFTQSDMKRLYESLQSKITAAENISTDH